MTFALLSGFKALGAFMYTFRLYFLAGAVISCGVIVFNYVDNHGEMKAQIIAGEATINDQVLAIRELREALRLRDEQLAEINTKRRIELAEARHRLEEADATIRVLRQTNQVIREELEVTRFETLEAIRDDEDFADWVDWDVPPVAWSLLQQSAEGN